MDKRQIIDKLIRLPFVGQRIGWWLMRNYSPTENLDVLMETGPYGERMYLSVLATSPGYLDLLFKVYTSEKALEQDGIVATIWLARIELRDNFTDEEQRARFLDIEFKKAKDAYIDYMQSTLQEHRWEAVANGKSFEVNATGKVARAEGIEVTIEEHEGG